VKESYSNWENKLNKTKIIKRDEMDGRVEEIPENK
jgi:hypothetical protein